ncbi:MAG: DNA repair protein RecN [Chloroflexi bacterium]|nr:MAG: DNA repair protein RecN [Chloroflexota bacterium]
MLLELAIRNFAVIRDTRLAFSAGMNALTGETGAGKSIVIDALGVVLGARASAEFIRSGERSAYVEAVFDITAIPNKQTLLTTLEDLGIEQVDTEPLVLSREIASSGRTTARINGRTYPASALAAIGSLLVDIHGQSDHLSLLRPAAQLDMLDHFAGVWELRSQLQQQLTAWRALRRRIRDFDDEQRERAQRLDLLRFQAEELRKAGLREHEDQELVRERDILLNAERLTRAATLALAAIEGEPAGADYDAGALDRLRAADAAISDIVAIDAVREPLLVQLRDALFMLEEVTSELRLFAEATAFDPARLEVIDDRLDELRRLKRKYGPELRDVIAHAAAIDDELDRLERDVGDVDALRASEQCARANLRELAVKLSDARKVAAEQLSERVVQAIAELNMGRADFAVRFDVTPDPDGLAISDAGPPVAIDASGIDRVTFLLAANAGEELRPLGRVASGGETARLMLALKSILSEADNTPTLVFDEIDVGVGGRSGQVVGEKLWGLTQNHQVIVISHLAQIAAFADHHVTLLKRDTNGRTETTATELVGAARIEELAAMFDGLPPTPESRANASALLKRVETWKAEHTR